MKTRKYTINVDIKQNYMNKSESDEVQIMLIQKIKDVIKEFEEVYIMDGQVTIENE